MTETEKETVVEMTPREYILWVVFEKRTIGTSALVTLLAACMFSEAAAENFGWFIVRVVGFLFLSVVFQVIMAVTDAGTVDSS